MKTNSHINYYCFNKACHGSIYHSNTIQITDLPLNMATLSIDHLCPVCNQPLVSIIDIELKQALNPAEPNFINYHSLLALIK